MPEGPEVKRNAKNLSRFISGKTIDSIEILGGRYTKSPISGFLDYKEFLPDKIIGVGVHGKFIYIICSSGYNIWSTLGMSGKWTSRLGQHSRIGLEFSDQSQVFFDDIRNFGTIKLVYGKKKLLDKINSLGPDMLSSEVSNATFIARLRKKNHWNVCKAIMNQAVIAGIGNYIKAESLWLSGISPLRTVEDISDLELSNLNSATKQIMAVSYDSGGATILTHKDFFGSSGNYSDRFLCYGRSVDVDGNKVIKTKTPDGRITHWAPEKQR